MSNEHGWRANVLLAVGATVLSLALVAVAGEIMVRYRERHRDSVPGTMPFLYYRNGRLGQALVRDNDYFGWVKVDHQGFRGRDVTVEPSPGMLRIMAVGGSTTFDAYAGREGSSWPERLGFWLSQIDSAQRVEVINAGVPGYRVIDNLIRLQTELYQYKPDIIILYEGHNDLFAALRWGAQEGAPASSRPGEVPVVTPWQHWLENHSLLYTKLLGRWQAISFQRSGGRALMSGGVDRRLQLALQNGSEQFRRDLTGFLVLAKNLDIPVVLIDNSNVSGPGARDADDAAIRGIWEHGVPFAPVKTVLEGYDMYNQVISKAARDYSAVFISTREFGLVGTEWFAEGDPIHFNERGADRMGHAMAQALVSAGVLEHDRAAR